MALNMSQKSGAFYDTRTLPQRYAPRKRNIFIEAILLLFYFQEKLLPPHTKELGEHIYGTDTKIHSFD